MYCFFHLFIFTIPGRNTCYVMYIPYVSCTTKKVPDLKLPWMTGLVFVICMVHCCTLLLRCWYALVHSWYALVHHTAIMAQIAMIQWPTLLLWLTLLPQPALLPEFDIAGDEYMVACCWYAVGTLVVCCVYAFGDLNKVTFCTEKIWSYGILFYICYVHMYICTYVKWKMFLPCESHYWPNQGLSKEQA